MRQLVEKWNVQAVDRSAFASCPFAPTDGSWQPWALIQATRRDLEEKPWYREILWTCLLCDRCPAGFAEFVVEVRRLAWKMGLRAPRAEHGLLPLFGNLADAGPGVATTHVLPEARPRSQGETLVLAGPLLPMCSWPDPEVARRARTVLSRSLEALERAGLQPTVAEREPYWDITAAWAGDVDTHRDRIGRVAELVRSCGCTKVVCLSALEALALRDFLRGDGPPVLTLYEALGKRDADRRHAEPPVSDALFAEDPQPGTSSFLELEPPGAFEGATCGVRGWQAASARTLKVQDALLAQAGPEGLVVWDPESYLHLARRTGPGTWVTSSASVRFGPDTLLEAER